MDKVGEVREARAIRRRAFDAMASGHFDAAKVNADLLRARTLEFEARSRLERDMVTFSATLPPEERANLAAAMRATMVRLTFERFQRQRDARQPDRNSAGPGPARPGA